MRYPRKAKKGPTIEADEKESKAEAKRERASVGGEKAAEAKEKRRGYRRGGFVPPSPLKGAIAKLKRPTRLPKPVAGMTPPPMGDVGMLGRLRRQAPPFIAPPPMGA